MPPHPRSADEDVLEAAGALTRVAPLVSRWIERLLVSHEPPLTLAQYLALRALAEGELVGAELARLTGVSPAAVSQLVGALEAAGLVERIQVPADRRRQRLDLSPAGSSALSSAEARLRTSLASMVAELPGREAHVLGRALRSLDALLGGTAPPPRPRRPPKPPERPV